MADTAAIRAGKAFVELFTDDVNFLKGLQRAKKQFDAWGKAITAAGYKIFAAGTAITAPLGFAIKQYANMGAEIARAAEITGTAVEQISALKYAAEQSGVSLDHVVMAFKYMSKAIESGELGAHPAAAKAIAAIGLSVEDLRKMDSEGRIEAIADAIKNIKDPALKETVSQAIMGRGGDRLIPWLDLGSQGIKKMTDEAQAMGFVMSNDAAQGALAMERELTKLWTMVKFVSFTIIDTMAPILRQLSKTILSMSKPIQQWIKDHKGLATVIAATGVALVTLGGALIGIGWVMQSVSFIWGAVAGIFGAVLTIIGSLFTPFGALIAILVAVTVAGIYFSGTWGNIVNFLKGAWATLKSDALEAFGGIEAAMESGNWAAAAAIMWSAIKLEWARGIGWIQTTWVNFSSEFAREFDAISLYVLQSVSRMATGIQQHFLEVAGLVVDTTQQLAELQQVQDQYERSLGGVANGIDTVIGDEQRASLAAIQKSIDEAKAELDSRVADAHAGHTSEVFKTPGSGDGAAAATAKAGKSVGTFFGSMVWGLGGSGPLAKIAENTKKIEENTRGIGKGPKPHFH